MNIRKPLYFAAHRLVGNPLGQEYQRVVERDRTRFNEQTTRHCLADLLAHSKRAVPYYSRLMERLGGDATHDPLTFLQRLPILTKAIIRQQFEQLQSTDLARRKWYYNTSGGSTGEPVKLIQDQDFGARLVATQILMSNWAGRQVGEPAVLIWGSERDVLKLSIGPKMSILNRLNNTSWLNAYNMSRANMRATLERLNASPPNVIIAYVQAIYELAQFAEREQLAVRRQRAIMTTAGTLHPFIREKVEAVFQCKILDRYGSREVGDIACECPAHTGLHVFPWNAYVEIVDDQGTALAPGAEGNIVVTCLTNYAMPLLRYWIGDRGIMSEREACPCGRAGQRLERIVGRSVDMFKKKDGTMVSGGYFTKLLYFRDWIRKFQVVQKSHTLIVFRIVRAGSYRAGELDEISAQTRAAMGADCTVSFEFVDDIASSASGKYSYTLSEAS